MTVLELRPTSPSPARWTEVCATEHSSPSSVRAVAARTVLVRNVPARGLPERTVPERTMPRTVAGTGVRSCRPSVAAPARVVDDVPTWVLLACGVLFGLLMVFALAFVGGPAYA